MPAVQFKKVSKFFGSTEVLKDIDLNIDDGAFCVLVGPSGCGKSTTLRILAGLEQPTSGRVFIGRQEVSGLPPKERDIAMVFQNYALYPHMTVFDNMAYGLKIRKYPKEEIRRRVEEAAEVLGLSELLMRKPKALSGGQRQRVALGRAIVRQPKVFLFDEPLSNLDAKLRVQMRIEIKKLHQRLQTTMVYVTHDQVEAMTMGQRIVVMNEGRIQQADEPLQVYNHPKNMFVAGFIGSPAMNFVEVSVARGRFIIKDTQSSFEGPSFAAAGERLVTGIRPEYIRVSNNQTGMRAWVELIEPLGDHILARLKLNRHDLTARLPVNTNLKTGQEVFIHFDAEKLHFFNRQTGDSLSGL